MKDFHHVTWESEQCRQEQSAFQALLSSSPEIEERKHALPFFLAHPQLSVFLGSYDSRVRHYDLLAYEYELFGDFASDLVVGDSHNKVFGFIEFEEGTENSVFIKRSGKATPEWAPRFVQGFCQLVDWFYKLDDMERTRECEDRFGAPDIDYFGLLVVGRSSFLAERERRRLHWWEEKVLINSHKIHCVTFDQLYSDLEARLQRYAIIPPRPTRNKRKK
jgi:hypothetical protein